MIVNEDYFNKLKITDDDIVVDSNEHNKYDLDTANEFLQYCKDSFDHTLIIDIIEMKTITLDEVYYYAQLFRKKLYVLFDCFNIQHSELFISDNQANMSSNLNMFKCHDCKFISPEDVKDMSHKDGLFHLVIYLRFPEMTPRTAIRFIDNLLKLIWKQKRNIKRYGTYIHKPQLSNMVLMPYMYDESYWSSSGIIKTISLQQYYYRQLITYGYTDSDDDDAKEYFFDVMYYFFGTEKTNEMRRLSNENKNPYTGSDKKYTFE